MGGVFFPEDAGNKVGLIKKADQALYRAKAAGRDRYDCSFDATVDDIDQNVEKLQYIKTDTVTKQGLLN